MRSKIKGLMAVSALLLTVIPTHAEVVPEVSFSGGYTDNLFNDSSSIDDGYTAVSPLFKIYPSSTAEITLGGTYTIYYSDTIYSDLTNLHGTAGLTIIPNLDNSPFNLMFSAGLSGRGYGELFEAYNSWGVNLSAIFSYKLGQKITFRGGASAAKTDYPNSPNGGSEGLGFFGGLNTTPFGSNSFNFEAGLNLSQYVTGLDTLYSGGGGGNGGGRPASSASVAGTKSDFHTASISIRFSRPLGVRTGINAFYTERWFVEQADSVVEGFSVNYLSPWFSLWEGRSIGTNIKHFPGLDFIIESGLSFTDKQYIQNLEWEEETIEEGDSTVTIITDIVHQRSDERTSVYVQIQRPFTTKSGMLVKPSILIRYVDNQSSDLRFQYSYPEVKAVIYFRF